MATWHQTRNKPVIAALWQAHPTQWKVVDDGYNRFASAMLFNTQEEARVYINNAGGILVPPRKGVTP